MALKSFKTNTLNGVSDINGLVHINTETFSGAVSISLDDVFTSTYDNYRILVDLDGTTSTDSTLALRLRVGGVDNSSANYGIAYRGLDQSGASNDQSGATTSAFLFRTESTANSHFYSASIDIFRPQKAEITVCNILSSGISASGNFASNAGSFFHNVSTSYDGFTLFAGYNIAGKVRVYGYKN